MGWQPLVPLMETVLVTVEPRLMMFFILLTGTIYTSDQQQSKTFSDFF